jgi:alkylhydroperoxidase family enzyme
MTLRVDVPADKDPLMYVWGEMVPGIGPAAARFSGKVYEDTTLDLEAFEAARLRIAQINGCLFCQDWRTDFDGQVVDPGFFDEVASWQDSTVLSERTKLSAEYAERYANDHHGIDDEFFARLKGSFTDAELVELSMCIGSWIAFGRLNRVFGLDEVCQLPSDLAKKA